MNTSSDFMESSLPDLTNIDFTQLRSGEGDVLSTALRRVREQAAGDPVVAGFQSSI